MAYHHITMTHEPEYEFIDVVREKLIHLFGDANVIEQFYIKDGNRFCDFIVYNGLFHMAIEVENDFEAVFKGIGQAIVYSGYTDNCIPVVVVPEGHVEHPEVEVMRQYVPIVEL